MLFPSDHTRMISELLGDDSDKLTVWDITFLENIDKQITPLSVRQVDLLKKIWAKVFK